MAYCSSWGCYHGCPRAHRRPRRCDPSGEDPCRSHGTSRQRGWRGARPGAHRGLRGYRAGGPGETLPRPLVRYRAGCARGANGSKSLKRFEMSFPLERARSRRCLYSSESPRTCKTRKPAPYRSLSLRAFASRGFLVDSRCLVDGGWGTDVSARLQKQARLSEEEGVRTP